MTRKKTALILSGGGARGAFQCGAEKYARDEMGYGWDILAGVSVGALNALMLSMGKFESLFKIWNTLTGDQVYTDGKPLKYFETKIIQPDFPLNDILDFSQTSLQRSLRAGMEKAKQVLGC
jgi:predicted acylesterase/phospholipase RssA